MDRRNLIYSLILVVLVVALVTVGILVLRKRAAGPVLIPVGGSVGTDGPRPLPTDTKSLDSYTKAPAWKEGDPVPPEIPDNLEAPPSGDGDTEVPTP
jgi:hypothetical protein